MLLRSLRIVHFRGISDLHVRQFGESGVQAVRLPGGTDPSMLAEALRFGFLGRTRRPTPWISAAEGFVFVEVAFRTAAGGVASVFRGADRHGAVQVSLREDGGGRISSGEAEVASRLAELAGTPLDRWEGATFVGASGTSGTSGAPAAPAEPEETPESAPQRDAAPADAPPVRAAHPLEDEIASLRRAAVFAVDRLRRSLRAAAVQREAETAFRELSTLGARLRRERRTASGAAEKKRAERERFAARVAAHEKSQVVAAPHELLGAPHAPSDSAVEPSLAPSPVPAPEPRRPPRWLETALGVSALTSLGALLLWASSAEIRGQRGIGAALTATFLGSAAVCAAVAWTRRRDRPHEPEEGAVAAEASSPTVRTAEEPRRDDADLRSKIRERAATLESEIAAAEQALEETDAAAAQIDLAIHRAALLLRAAEPAPEEHADGLEAGTTAADARTTGADLADRVCRLCVERDALVARDAVSPRVAALAVESEFARLAEDEAEATALLLLLHGARAEDVETRPPADAHVFAEALRAEVSRLAEAAQRTALRGSRARELVGAAAGAHGGADPGSRTNGSEPRFLPEALAGEAAEAAGRELAGLAARLRDGDALLPAGEAGTAPRVVVLDRRPGSLATDADLAAFVARESPRATQVVLGVS